MISVYISVYRNYQSILKSLNFYLSTQQIINFLFRFGRDQIHEQHDCEPGWSQPDPAAGRPSSYDCSGHGTRNYGLCGPHESNGI